MIKLGVKNCSRGGKLLPAFFFTRFYSLGEGDKEKDGRNQQPFRHGTEASFGCRATVSRGRARARKAGVKSAAVAVRRSLAYAPCGDAGGKGDAVAATRRQGEKAERRCEQDEEREENLKELTGFPQRFCEAKDLREEETQAERSSRKERSGGPAGFAATRRQGRAGSPAIYSLRHGVGLTTPPSCLWQATVSAAQGERRLGQEISPQWEISKLASGKEPTGLFARKHLLAPYTGEAILRRSWQATVSRGGENRLYRISRFL